MVNLNSSVLVVDDEENLLVLLDRVLSKEGYQVKTAIDGYEALEFLDENDISVALIGCIPSVVLISWWKSKSGLLPLM